MDLSRRIDLFYSEENETKESEFITCSNFEELLRYVEIANFFKYPFLPEILRWTYVKENEKDIYKIYIPKFQEACFNNDDLLNIYIHFVGRLTNFLKKYNTYIKYDAKSIRFCSFQYKKIFCPIIIPSDFAKTEEGSLTTKRAFKELKQDLFREKTIQEVDKIYEPSIKEMCDVLDGIEYRFKTNFDPLSPLTIVNNFAMKGQNRIAMLATLKRSAINEPRTAIILASLYTSNLIGAPNPVRALTFCNIARKNIDRLGPELKQEINKIEEKTKKLNSFISKMEDEANIRADIMYKKFKAIEKCKNDDVKGQIADGNGNFSIDIEIKRIMDEHNESLKNLANDYLQIAKTDNNPISKCSLFGRAALITGDQKMLEVAAFAGDPLSQYHFIKRKLKYSLDGDTFYLIKDMLEICKFNYPRLDAISSFVELNYSKYTND